MWGNTKRTHTYYICKKNKKFHGHLPWYGRHPQHVMVREDIVLPPVARFFKERIFGSSRKVLLQDTVPDGSVDPNLEARRATVHAELANLQRRQNNLMSELERYTPSGDPDFDDAWRSGIQSRFAANAGEQRTKSRLLAELTRELQESAPPDFSLIESLPLTAIDITLLPEEQQRHLYGAFHLEVRYDLPTHTLVLRVTIDAETAPALINAVDRVTPPTPATPAAEETAPPVPRPRSAAGWDALRSLPRERPPRHSSISSIRFPGIDSECGHLGVVPRTVQLTVEEPANQPALRGTTLGVAGVGEHGVRVRRLGPDQRHGHDHRHHRRY